MKTQAIIAAGGTGERLGSPVPKPFIELCGKPLCLYALEAFEKSPVIDSVILVGEKAKIPEFEKVVERYGLGKVVKVVAGGPTRRASVANGLAALDDDTEAVAVHDGARPLVSAAIIAGTVQMGRTHGAAVAAVPVTSTIKRVDRTTARVRETLNREELWEVQTPQVFSKDILMKAHAAGGGDNPTDDAAMVEQLGVEVRIFEGDYRNIKITTREDLMIAETFLTKGNG